VIKQSAYGTEPWRLVENRLDLDLLAQSESIFALSNGHIGLRGNLDEGDPHALPGSYLNSFYEVRPLPYAEAGYGFPETGQTVINVTNGKIIRLLVDDEPFDIRYGTLHSHERVFDMRAGTLTRQVDWSSPVGARIKVTSVRMVSLTQRAIAAINYTVEPTENKLRLVVQSELVANEELPQVGKDPRLSAILQSPLVSEEHQIYHGGLARVVLVHKTRASGLRMAAGMSHEITGPERMRTRTECFPDLGRTSVAAEVAPGEKLHIPEDHYPLLHYPYFQLYRKQVVKQADLVLAMHLRPDAFSAKQKASNFAYYEPLTVRDSSLSACTQAVIATEVGQLELAHDYLAEAALMDLRDVQHNTSDGVHMAARGWRWWPGSGACERAPGRWRSARTCRAGSRS
jgi:trehalose/maltose hydrolase-like predicted phosphorylase